LYEIEKTLGRSLTYPQPIPTQSLSLLIGFNVQMQTQSSVARTRRPRFRRAWEPPAFRLTDDDVKIVRQLARHRFLPSTHIAALVGRPLDRTNDRLSRLFHAGYLDRPRAQLDYYPKQAQHRSSTRWPIAAAY
jgi:hypothetical protein